LILKATAAPATLVLVSLLTACISTDTAPENPHLDGQWHLDAPASDNPDAKISVALAGAESKLRQRLANAGYSEYAPPGGETQGRRRHGRGGGAGGSPPDDSSSGGAELNGDEYTATGFIGPDFAGLRQELRLVLNAPKQLTIAVSSDSVRIGSDSAPVREYPVGDTFTRIDEYGSARIDSRWKASTFELRARYSNHATLIERYSGDAQAHTLSVTLDLSDPVVGKLSVHCVYRQ
jgi:hypothetical protein